MSKVYIRNASYDYSVLRTVIFEILDATCGDRIQRNSSVLIKPNLLAPAPPDRAVVTHPLVVKAAAEYVLERGVRPIISDSPAVGSFEKIVKESGLKETLEGLDVEFKVFAETTRVDVGKPFGNIEIAKDAISADVLINLAKLKTHAQMLLTLGVKNLFGCIVGMKKPEWHFRTGVDREMFARLLVKVCQAVRPAVTIIDGILAMEGQGPGKGGTPRHLGVVLGGVNAVELDMTVCRMIGIPPGHLPTNRSVMSEGLTGSGISVDGELTEVTDFTLPEMAPLVFGPGLMHGFMRRHLVQRPACNDGLCRMCGECWNYCPAKAITRSGKKLLFDYDKCIRCYCCIEVCPYGALKAAETLTGKMARRVLKIRSS